MATTCSKHMGAALIGLAVLSSCSRPVAYFQRSQGEHVSQTAVIPTTAQTVESPVTLLTQAQANDTTIESYVRNDSKLATHKKLSQRMIRVKALLAATHGTLSPKETSAPRRMNLVERLMVKKLNRKIGRQLALVTPEKALVNHGQLIGGAVLLIGGLLLLILGTGTVAFIGLILSLVGALGVLFGLFGLDS